MYQAIVSLKYSEAICRHPHATCCGRCAGFFNVESYRDYLTSCQSNWVCQLISKQGWVRHISGLASMRHRWLSCLVFFSFRMWFNKALQQQTDYNVLYFLVLLCRSDCWSLSDCLPYHIVDTGTFCRNTYPPITNWSCTCTLLVLQSVLQPSPQTLYSVLQPSLAST